MERSKMFRKNIAVGKNNTIQRIGFTFAYCFGVEVQSARPEFKLEYSSPIQSEWVMGIQTRRAKAGALSVNQKALVNDAVFDSSFITLKQRNAEVFEKIPLWVIEQSTLNGLIYQVDIPNIDMAQSTLLCTSPGSLVQGEEYEFVMFYYNTIEQLREKANQQ